MSVHLVLPVTKALEPTALTQELKAVLPDLDGVGLDAQVLVIRKLPGTGEFSAAEAAQVRQLVGAHDAAAALARQAQRHQRRLAAPQAIETATSLPELRRALLDLVGRD